MIRAMQRVMRLGYRLTWPIAGLHLHNSKRVRVLVTNKLGDILLVKSTYGTQKWELPGGGIGRREESVAAAIRELHEETGVVVSERDLVKMGEDRVSSRDSGWPTMNVLFFQTKVSNDSLRVVRPLEIVGLQWFAQTDLPQDLGNCARVALKLAAIKK